MARNNRRKKKGSLILSGFITFIAVGLLSLVSYKVLLRMSESEIGQEIVASTIGAVEEIPEEALQTVLVEDQAALPTNDWVNEAVITEERVSDEYFWGQSPELEAVEAKDSGTNKNLASLSEATGIPADIAALSTKDELQKRADIGITVDSLNELEEQQYGKYWFMHMQAGLRPLYLEILSIMSNLEENIVLSSVNDKNLGTVFNCVMSDHPELFYVKAYRVTGSTVNGKLRKISFSGVYTMDKAGVQAIGQKLEKAIAKALSGISNSASQYEKVKYIYEYIINNTEYVTNAPDNQNIISVLLNGRSVCSGYARTAQLLLERLDVPITLVLGVAGSPDSGVRLDHAWNLVNIDGYYYYFDATWGDASYFLNGDSASGSGNAESINYDYLNVTTTELSYTHTPQDIVPMPRCVSIDANYFVREGAYFETIDGDFYTRLSLLEQKRREKGEKTLSIKCADFAAYQAAVNELINASGIFRVISTNGESLQLSYSTNDAQRTLTFWL